MALEIESAKVDLYIVGCIAHKTFDNTYRLTDHYKLIALIERTFLVTKNTEGWSEETTFLADDADAKETKLQYNNKWCQAHKAEVERIMEIPGRGRTEEEVNHLTDDAAAKEAKRRHDIMPCEAYKVEVEQIINIPEGQRSK